MPMKVLELYSGVGGHHAAFALAQNYSNGREGSVSFFAFDVNEQANSVYALNFGETPSSKDIARLEAHNLDSMGADLWAMSPPCQPYTRNGSRLESDDARARSFISLMQTQFPLLQRPPSHILLENVLGFERSDSFEALTKALEVSKYTWQGYIINPNTCGIPNSRPRFYLLAKRGSPFKVSKGNGKCNNSASAEIGGLIQSETPTSIQSYLVPSADLDPALLVSHRSLWKAGDQYDIVRPHSARTCCFTKGYGQFARGTGSVLCMASDLEILSAAVQLGFDKTVVENQSNANLGQTNWNDGDNSESVISALQFIFAVYRERKAQHKPMHSKEYEPAPRVNIATGKLIKQKNVSAKRKREIDMERGSWPDQLEACPIAALRLRHFSVKEVARLQGFPKWFEFPANLTNEQGWKLLGNSINVKIVSGLMKFLLDDGPQ